MTFALVDTSTWSRRRQETVKEALAEAINANWVLIVHPIKLELLQSARDAREWSSLVFEYDTLEEISVTANVVRRAIDVQGQLARRGHHRGPSPVDLVAAAAAESVGAEVWHCDRHYELIAAVTGQPVRKVGR